MVVTSFPAARDTGVLHDRPGRPSRCTVQAPHCATPQPYLVPVRPICSRNTQSRGVEGSTSTFTLRLFTVKEITGINLLREKLSASVHPLACIYTFPRSRFSEPRAPVPVGTATGASGAQLPKRKRSRLPGPRQFLRGRRFQRDCVSKARCACELPAIPTCAGLDSRRNSIVERRRS